MSKWKIRVLSGCISILLCSNLTGCSFGENSPKLVFTTGFAKDEIFKMEDESCKLSEIMVYLTTTQNQYEGVYGEEIWGVTLNGVTLEENVKETVLAKIAQIKTMYLLAKQRNVTLSTEEEKLVEAAAKEYFSSLNESEITEMEVSLPVVEKLYAQYAIADKVYQEIIKDINPEISDDEARTITVQHILIKTYTTNGAGKVVKYSESSKEAAYNRAQELRDLAVSDQDFQELATKYSEDDNITYSFGKGEMDLAFEEAAFNLETGEISRVIESESGYHIIKCITTFNREETDVNKLKIVEQRRKEVFGQEYDEFVASLTRNLNQELWDSVGLIHNEKVTTSDFFDVYMRYFPK
ncbi:peptidylprolyl isomerase [Lachnospiraceae bacterium OttesenSCG-928-D06]|nr:peptidylprolyl isomerase [Lachnospiraceae bacterium OttesenSCG-928-D06]